MIADQLIKMPEPDAPIHAGTHLGTVDLTIADLARSVEFYKNVIGLEVIERDEQHALMGVGGTPLLKLHELKGATRQPRRSTGLYHVAILLPSREDLGRWLLHMERTKYPVQGFADHLVSEAVYLSDPDGNGLEVYRDRPRSEWQWDGKTVKMASDPIDLEGVVASVPDPGVAWAGAPVGTTIGHIHLRVGDIPLTEAFYHRILGFDIVAVWSSALFMSAGGYHHHLGANTWQSAGAPHPPEDSVGLRRFTIMLPNIETQNQIVQRLESAALPFERAETTVFVDDPWGIHISLTVENPL